MIYFMKKTCYKCGTSNLDWSQPYHQLTGKWKLESHQKCSGV